MSRGWCAAIAGGVRITVQVAPNARKSEVAGILDDALKMRLQAQPIEGRANEALIRCLADLLDVPKSAVSIVHGHASKRKVVDVLAPAMTVERASRALTGE